MISYSDAQQLLAGVEVVTNGSGPVVALAHGAGGGVRENFAPLFDAVPGRRLTGPYYPGTGGTAAGEHPLELETLADTVVAAGVVAGGQRFPVIGLSLGCAVAVTAAVRHPEHVSALVLTVGFARPDAQSRAFTAVWQGLAAAGDLDSLAQFLLYASPSAGTLAALTAEQHSEIVAEIGRTYPRGSIGQAELVSCTDVTSLLDAVRVPVLVVAAGDDRIVTPHSTRDLAARIPGAELVEYPDAGHIFTPAEAGRWAADITRFLSAPA